MNKNNRNASDLKQQIDTINSMAKELEEKTDYVKIPIGVYLMEREMASFRERQLLSYINVLFIGFVITVLLIVGGFLYYISLFDYSNSNSDICQDIESDGGSSYIYDGIHIKK